MKFDGRNLLMVRPYTVQRTSTWSIVMLKPMLMLCAVELCVDLMKRQFYTFSSIIMMIESVPRKSLNGPSRTHSLINYFTQFNQAADDDPDCPEELLLLSTTITIDYIEIGCLFDQ